MEEVPKEEPNDTPEEDASKKGEEVKVPRKQGRPKGRGRPRAATTGSTSVGNLKEDITDAAPRRGRLRRKFPIPDETKPAPSPELGSESPDEANAEKESEETEKSPNDKKAEIDKSKTEKTKTQIATDKEDKDDKLETEKSQSNEGNNAENVNDQETASSKDDQLVKSQPQTEQIEQNQAGATEPKKDDKPEETSESKVEEPSEPKVAIPEKRGRGRPPLKRRKSMAGPIVKNAEVQIDSTNETVQNTELDGKPDESDVKPKDSSQETQLPVENATIPHVQATERVEENVETKVLGNQNEDKDSAQNNGIKDVPTTEEKSENDVEKSAPTTPLEVVKRRGRGRPKKSKSVECDVKVLTSTAPTEPKTVEGDVRLLAPTEPKTIECDAKVQTATEPETVECDVKVQTPTEPEITEKTDTEPASTTTSQELEKSIPVPQELVDEKEPVENENVPEVSEEHIDNSKAATTEVIAEVEPAEQEITQDEASHPDVKNDELQSSATEETAEPTGEEEETVLESPAVGEGQEQKRKRGRPRKKPLVDPEEQVTQQSTGRYQAWA